jgi:ABC-type antimicrobial peptide transport system permease subunit
MVAAAVVVLYLNSQRPQILEILGSVLSALTMAVAAPGSISLFVGGVGIFTIMTIAVRERTQEIDLLRSQKESKIKNKGHPRLS